MPSPELAKKLEEEAAEKAPKLTVEERQQLLMKLLRENSGLEQLKEWPPELAVKFEHMLMEHHHIFSLDKNEIGCTDAAKHIIELMDDEPFKERFRQIAPRPPTAGRSLRELAGHAGRRCDLAFQLPMVQRDSPRSEEGRNAPFLY